MQAKYSVVTYPSWEPHLFLKLKYRRQEKKEKKLKQTDNAIRKKIIVSFLAFNVYVFAQFPISSAIPG